MDFSFTNIISDHGGYKQVATTIDTGDILRFHIVNHQRFRKDGGFRRFDKEGTIVTRFKKHGAIFIGIFRVSIADIRRLRRLLVGRYASRKETYSVSKRTRLGVVPRKATDWIYTIR